GERVSRGRRQMRLLAVPDRIVPGEQADAGDHEKDAEHGPHERPGRRRVADQWLVGPVAGVADRTVGTVGCRGPTGPEEESGELLAVSRVSHRVVAHGIGFTQGLRCRIIAEKADVVTGHIRYGERAIVRYGNRVAV